MSLGIQAILALAAAIPTPTASSVSLPSRPFLLLILLNRASGSRILFAASIVSWLLLLALARPGHSRPFHVLRVAGRPRGPIEKHDGLVTVGAYRYIRHPLYASLLFLAWGRSSKTRRSSAAYWPPLRRFLTATARVEEVETLGNRDDYAAYVRRTRMFIPFVL